MAIILVIAFLVLYANLWVITKKTRIADGNTIFALPYTVAIFFSYLFVITELLSLFDYMIFHMVAISWGLFIVINCICFCGIKKRFEFQKRDILPSVKELKNEKYWVIIFVLFSFVMIILAYYTAPYNLDSIACYLPKVTHWAQNQSVKHYATNALEQITTPDFAQYIRLHIYILDGLNDRHLTLVQCASYIIAALFVYLISRKLGCEKKWSYISVAIFLSLPITFAEALNTQYDLITAVFVLAFVLLLMDYFEESSKICIDFPGLLHTAMIGVCIGLAFISKTTTGFIIAVFVLALFRKCFEYKIGWKKFGVSLSVATISAVIFILPKFIRTYYTFGTFFTEDFSTNHIVETADPRLLFLCFFKNFLFNFSGHFIYNSKNIAEKTAAFFAEIFHVNLVDPRISLYNDFVLNEPFDFNHDRGTGELICILFCIALVMSIVLLVKKKFDSKRTVYVAAAFISFVLFLSLLKFTTHRTRYEICYFALLCPAVCIIFQNHLSDKVQMVFRSCITLLCICELLSLLIYHSEISIASNGGERPLAGFKHMQYTWLSYVRCTDLIKENGYKTIGLTGDEWFEYQIWVMTSDYAERIECVNVDNATSVYEDEEFFPDCILYMGTDRMEGVNNISCHGLEYRIIGRFFDDGYTWYIVAEKIQD